MIYLTKKFHSIQSASTCTLFSLPILIQFCHIQVNFLTKLVALKPGKTVREMIKNVMQGKDEGADDSDTDETSTNGRRVSSGIAGRVSFSYAIIILYFH